MIPFLIACFCVLFVAIIALMTWEKKDLYGYLNDIKIGSENVRWRSAFELSTIIAKNKNFILEDRFVAEMISLYKSPQIQHDDKRIRYYLASAMGQTDDLRFVPTLLSAIDRENDEDLIPIIRSLGLIRSPECVSTLHQFIDHPLSAVRLATVIALGNIGDPKSIEYLKKSLFDQEPNVTWDSAIALAKMGDDSGKTILIKLLDRKYLSTFEQIDEYEKNQILMIAIQTATLLADDELDQLIDQIAEDREEFPKVRNVAFQSQTHRRNEK